ncbi:hypothetical protein MUP01_10775 [Candidatus Bathyarchaeota archaeon]|nr:hypothetical protein [Candidatus Bathyarchaeota archaeon]
MRPKWIIGLAIGLFFLYVSYFGVAGIGLTLYPSRTTNLQAGMSWTSTETFGSSYTYTVASVVGSVVTVRQIGTMIEGGSPFPIDQLDVFDVTNTANATSYYEPQVVASGLGIGVELFHLGYPPYGPIHGYVSTIETVAGKNLLVSNWSYTNGAGVTIKFTTKYYQDSGVEYSSVEFDPPGWTPFIRYQCTSSDPVSGVPPNYHIVASSGIGGSISPSGSVTVTSGGSQSFTITANGGYQISNVLIDGSSQGAISSYSFTNVQADHTISAQFTLANGTTYTITASAGVGGSIIPLGNVIVNAGSSQSFTITSNNGYRISGILVDGISVGGVSSYTFTNVQTSHTISASFSVMPNPPPDYLVYLMIFLDALLGNSRLMLLVGGLITSISAIMLFWPKPKPQYQ